MRKLFECKKCKRELPSSEFYINRTAGSRYRKSICKDCDNKARLSRAMSWRPHTRVQLHKQYLSSLRYRRSVKGRITLLMKDARISDKRKGFDHHLDRAWVTDCISRPCFYCGDIGVLMTLDRIDNSKGHTHDNLNPACMRCNYLKRDMPFAAWMAIVPAIKAAREAGLFGSWDGFGRKVRKVPVNGRRLVLKTRDG